MVNTNQTFIMNNTLCKECNYLNLYNFYEDNPVKRMVVSLLYKQEKED